MLVKRKFFIAGGDKYEFLNPTKLKLLKPVYVASNGKKIPAIIAERTLFVYICSNNKLEQK